MINFSSKIKNKKAFWSLSLILLLATTLLMAFVQPSSAQVGIPQPEKTTGYISVAPRLIGVGQTATVNLWLFPLPTKYNYSPAFNGYYGVTVTFVRPDGTKDSFMPTDGTGSYVAGETEATGSLFFTHWSPNMAGNWSVSFTMPAQNITDSSGTVQYLGCTSNTAYFTVQTEPVLAGLLNGYPWAELPNSNVYWSYPINTNNREWSQISGDWTGINYAMATVVSSSCLRWQPYGRGPASAHIVWNQPVKEGGIMGGDYGSFSFSLGNSLYNIPIMDNKVCMNLPNTQPSGQSFGQFRCFDLTTGQVLYTANGTINYGLHVPGNSYTQSATSVALGEATVVLPNSFGAQYSPYLYGTATIAGVNYWNYYDPLTGVLIRQINNCSTARLLDGTELAYGAQSPTATGVNPALNGYVFRWNMTSVVNNNWQTGITWKVPLPVTAATGVYPSIFAVGMKSDVIVVGTKNQYWGYNSETGVKLWNITLTYPITSNEEFPLANVDDFIVYDSVAATFHCYSMATGAELWETPSFASSPWATTWTLYESETNDLNNMYIAFPDGTVRAYSLTDGHLLWTSTPFASTEYANNVVPYVYAGVVMEGGNVYVYGGYSTYYQLNPVPRFNMMVCINATTGDIEYTLNGGVCPYAAANGYVIGLSFSDAQMYCVGKGPTSTTVSAPDTSIIAGTTVLIKGSVLDMSPASFSATLTAMFANGVPAISDANMSVWMDYLHMQNSTLLNSPPSCIGVPVTLTAVDPNGNTINIGSTTSNGDGHFAYQWTPTTAGLYTIYATFAGTNSYFTSHGVTSATVTSAASPTATPTSATQPVVSNSDMIMYFAATAITIILAIAVVGALILRKK
jgi:hypothetical protein